MTGRLRFALMAVALTVPVGCGRPATPATTPGAPVPGPGTPPAPPTDADRLAELAAKFSAVRTSTEFAGVPFPGTYIRFDAAVEPDAARLAEFATGLKAVKESVVLDLTECKNLTPAGLAPLVEVECVAGLALKGDGVKALLPTVGKATQLRSLLVSDPTLVDADLAPLAPLVKLRALAVVGNPNGLTAAAYGHFGRMAELQTLKGNLASPYILFTDAELAHVSGLAALKELEIHPAAGGKLSDRGLANLKGMTGLEVLRIELTPGVTAESLGVIGGLKNLRELALSDQNAKPWPRAGTDRLLPLAGHLKTLKFNRSSFGDPAPPADAAWVGALGKFTALEILELRDAGLADKDLSVLAGLTQLWLLDLGKNPITGPGLAQLRPLTKLKDLELQSTALTDEAAAAIKGLPASVTTVNVRSTRITPPVLDDIEKSRKWESFLR